MKWVKNILKGLGILLGFLVLCLIVFGLYVYSLKDINPPDIQNREALSHQRVVRDTATYEMGNSFLQKNRYGLYEMYLEGEDFERGVVFGKLAKELLHFQEHAFTKEIRRMIPSEKYLKFLKYVVGFMNRNLSDYVLPEYQREIYGISMSASDEFNWIGSNYTRQLNYHAAHDIGHALANMMLVGCTSFATWNARSQDSLLTVGRNFDFFVGDDFAKNKIIAFYKPAKGIPFMSLTWAGFAGVVSGMNLHGLTVTINANKSAIPYGAATPVSLVAREILQYASNIEEAIEIARRRTMFVSESFLVSSAKDNKAIVIEKTPEELHVFESQQDYLLCTNHYQSKEMLGQKLNRNQMQNSASVYRYNRLRELLLSIPQNNPLQTAAILRDFKGMQGVDIGLTNEKALNQFIAHHSIIFQPQKLRVWVSTSPWQLGEYVCYDLKKIFSNPKSSVLMDSSLTIPADTFLYSGQYQRLKVYQSLKNLFWNHKPVEPGQIVTANPTFYDSYRIAGDIYRERNRKDSALEMYRRALSLEIATENERTTIMDKIKDLENE